ncbi:MAG: diaminopimelate decarboxylase, partial [Planctomycetes bacterium]|nr:diaminopimelate decarboxylase [Planctomycetota bacterium]
MPLAGAGVQHSIARVVVGEHVIPARVFLHDGTSRLILLALPYLHILDAQETLHVVDVNPAEPVARLGAGADVVSAGEMRRVLKAGVAPEKIVFSGVGKTADELDQALRAGILQINVESEAELDRLQQVAARRGCRAPVALRVNPDIDAHTHEKISTGRLEDKFGIQWTRLREVYKRAAGMPNIALIGLAQHIGSQVTDLGPFRDSFLRLRDLVVMLRADGHEIERLDVGGGLGIPYDDILTPSPAEYGALASELLGGLGYRLLFEPGRLLVGNAGILVARVIYIKEGATRRFAIIDAAMNDLLRPSLYGARHQIVPVTEPLAGGQLEKLDVVGPVCETGDSFGLDVPLPPLGEGDLVAIRTAGAYGAVMASTYNGRPLVPEVLVSGAAFAIVRRRMELDEFLAHEVLP